MHRVVGLGILYFVFASIEGVLRITGVSSAPSFRFCFAGCNIDCTFLYFHGAIKKGRDNGPVLITEIVLAVFDSCIIWFISFLYTSAVLTPAALQPSVSYRVLLVMNVLTLLFLLFLLYFAGSSFLSPSPPHLFHSSCFLWSCFILYCRQKTLTWPCWPAFLWLCLTLLYAGGYPFVNLCGVALPSPPLHKLNESHTHLLTSH